MANLTRDELKAMDTDRAKLLENIGDIGHIGNLLIIQGAHFAGFKAGLEYCRQDADGRLMAAAPELLQVCKELAAWITIAPEFQDWPAAQSRLHQLNQSIVKADPSYPVFPKGANVPPEYADERVRKLNEWFSNREA